MTDTPAAPDPQPTRAALELLRVLREWSARSGYRIWREQAPLIDRHAALATAAAVSGDARERGDPPEPCPCCGALPIDQTQDPAAYLRRALADG